MDAVTTAPAPTETQPTTQPAARDAVVRKDFRSFRDAERASEKGAPLPAVAQAPPAEKDDEPPTAADGQAPRQVSKRQADTNEKIRQAVERATADANARILALEAEKTQRPTAAAAVVTEQPAPQTPEYERYLAMPDAPKLENFTDLAKFNGAMSYFMAKKMLAEDREAASAQTRNDTATAEATKTVTTFQERVTAKGGKAFLDALAPDVAGLKPVESLQAQAAELHAAGKVADAQRLIASIGPLNVLTTEIIRSEHGPDLLQHLSDHPDDLARFKTCASPADVYREVGKLEARLSAPAPTTIPAKTVTSMSPPPTTLQARTGAVADPSIGALGRHDFRAFRAAEQSKLRSA